jgi:hypothetical protein
MRLLIKRFEDKELGSKRWFVPTSVSDAATEIMRQNDPVREFLGFAQRNQFITVVDPNDGRALVADVHRAFDCYMELLNPNGYTPWKITTFRRAMINNGYKQSPSHNTCFYKGLRLDPDWNRMLSDLFQGDGEW